MVCGVCVLRVLAERVGWLVVRQHAKPLRCEGVSRPSASATPASFSSSDTLHRVHPLLLPLPTTPTHPAAWPCETRAARFRRGWRRAAPPPARAPERPQWWRGGSGGISDTLGRRGGAWLWVGGLRGERTELWPPYTRTPGLVVCGLHGFLSAGGASAAGGGAAAQAPGTGGGAVTATAAAAAAAGGMMMMGRGAERETKKPRRKSGCGGLYFFRHTAHAAPHLERPPRKPTARALWSSCLPSPSAAAVGPCPVPQCISWRFWWPEKPIQNEKIVTGTNDLMRLQRSRRWDLAGSRCMSSLNKETRTERQ